MDGMLIQDWLTTRLAYNVTSLTQGESEWLDLSQYQDLTLWLEVSFAALATGVTSLSFAYETSPTKDEALFVPAATSSLLTAALSSPQIRTVILASNPTYPLARWLRWKLSAAGSGSSGASVITFRIAAAGRHV